MPSKNTLICDSRERHVLRHKTELADITIVEKQITTGDYVVVDNAGNFLAVIERKSLDDAAQSLKDGRWNNRDKMIELRRKTNCRILFIIEGWNGDPRQMCGRYLPYSHLESSLFHMMIRDNISIIWTRDTIDTARTLSRFVKSMDTLIEQPNYRNNIIGADDIVDKITRDVVGPTIINMPALLEHPHETPFEHAALDLLTQVHRKDDREIVREMWSCFKGIAVTTADEFVNKYSLSEIIRGAISKEDLSEFKMSTGKRPSKKIIENLLAIDRPLEARILSTIPGISNVTAKEIIEQVPLARLLTYEIGAISIIKIGKVQKNLGELKASAILRLCNYKGT